MLLYRYFASHVYETLKETRLKTSRITSFNDPFEFLFVTKGKFTAKMAREYVKSRLNNPDFLNLAALRIPGLLESKNPQRVLKANIPRIIANMVANPEMIMEAPLKLREQMSDKTTRVVSFSDSNINPLDEILLWSHYARMHEGIRIGFEFPNGIKNPFTISKIIYQDKRFAIDYSQGLTNLKYALVESAKVKSSAWRYENEYRLLTHPDFCEHRMMPGAKTECFLAFDREWIKSIDFGMRCPQEEINRIINLIKTGYSKAILCRKAVLHKSEYALEYEIL
ncbi:MAG: hypothetical protein JWQ04_509 [Pedosphaera sp.]|nr:hypothetical protein [Pedosphaera sp.]